MPDYAARIIGLYRRHAAAWAADRGDRLFEGAWLDRFLALQPPNAAILDLGCGSGDPLARFFIARGHHVTGVDTAPDMIRLCRQKFPEHTWYVTDMRLLTLDRVFTGILAWDSFFHLCPDDQRRMFSLFAKHAAPGTALMFTSGPAAGVAIGTFRGEPLYHASLDADEYTALLDAHGFTVVSHVVEDPACGRRTIWLARRR